MSSNILFPLAFLAALIPGLNILPELVKEAEKRIFPVITNMEFKQISRNGNKVRYHVYGEKERGCRYILADGYSIQGEYLSESLLTFPDDPTPNSTRPKGRQDFGIWEFDISDQPNAQSVFAVVKHDCGFWTLSTTIGPARIKQGNRDER